MLISCILGNKHFHLVPIAIYEIACVPRISALFYSHRHTEYGENNEDIILQEQVPITLLGNFKNKLNSLKGLVQKQELFLMLHIITIINCHKMLHARTAQGQDSQGKLKQFHINQTLVLSTANSSQHLPCIDLNDRK